MYDAEWETRYVDAICTEIDLRFKELIAKLPVGDRSVALETLYFGGGTPTVLSDESWNKIVDRLKRHANFSDNIEFTTEANPESSKPDKIKLLYELGANRISFGAQSFDSANLNRLGRLHNAAEVDIAIATARSAGFDNISLDLMYGLPDETDGSFDDDLKRAVALAPRHISFYSLMLEGAVPLRYQVQRREVVLPQDDVVSERYMRAVDFLAKSGYVHYEISNYAQVSFECRHNLAYWRHRNYIAFGPAAVGTIANIRYKNEPDIYRYVKRLSKGELPAADIEEITSGKRLIETIMLSIRLADGLDLEALVKDFRYDLTAEKRELLNKLVDGGDIYINGVNLRLSTKGMFRSDLIASALLPDFV